MTFPHVLRRENTWGTPPKVRGSVGGCDGVCGEVGESGSYGLWSGEWETGVWVRYRGSAEV
jgi:hypothetical protein